MRPGTQARRRAPYPPRVQDIQRQGRPAVDYHSVGYRSKFTWARLEEPEVTSRKALRSKMDEETRRYMGPIWERLDGGLWHTTRRDRLDAILRCGGIDPEPAGMPDSERWGTGLGPDYYPLVRHLGGVSLFDLTDFQIDSYREEFPLSSWAEFMPFRKAWGASIWIGIDRGAEDLNLISAEELKRIAYTQEGQVQRKRMPKIEIGNIGRIPVKAFTEAWLVSTDEVKRLDILR